MNSHEDEIISLNVHKRQNIFGEALELVKNSSCTIHSARSLNLKHVEVMSYTAPRLFIGIIRPELVRELITSDFLRDDFRRDQLLRVISFLASLLLTK